MFREPGVAFPLVLTPGLTSQVRHKSGAHKRDRFAKGGLSFHPAGVLNWGTDGAGGAMGLKDLNDVKDKKSSQIGSVETVTDRALFSKALEN